jgi:hypothetical protein
MSRIGSPPLQSRPRRGGHDAVPAPSHRGRPQTATVSSGHEGHDASASIRSRGHDTATISAGLLSSRVSVAFSEPRRHTRARTAASASAPIVDRQSRSEARLMAAAITSAMVCCFILIAYLTAYARIAQLGMLQSNNRVALRAAQLRNETLRAQCAALERPGRIEAKAVEMGMVLETKRVCYIEPGASGLPASPGGPRANQVALASGE